jgi:hypothetical protein
MLEEEGKKIGWPASRITPLPLCGGYRHTPYLWFSATGAISQGRRVNKIQRREEGEEVRGGVLVGGIRQLVELQRRERN